VILAFSPKWTPVRRGKRVKSGNETDFRAIWIGSRSIATERDLTDNPQDREQLVNEIIEVVAAEGMIDRAKVTPDATIESLDLKSVDIVMILTALEEKFNVYIPMDGTLQEAKDVKSLINAIVDLIIKEREKS
jgi:acyl carrier protein